MRKISDKIWSGGEWYNKQAECRSVYNIWLERFGEKLDIKQAIEIHDPDGEATYYMPNGYCVTFACDGNYINKIIEE